jgi:hypothetical protein
VRRPQEGLLLWTVNSFRKVPIYDNTGFLFPKKIPPFAVSNRPFLSAMIIEKSYREKYVQFFKPDSGKTTKPSAIPP